MFADRVDAGRRLAEALERFKAENPVVMALPRGGVPVAFEVAQALEAPLDLVLVRKIGAPFQPELAIGAVVDGPNPVTVLNESMLPFLQLPDDYIEQQRARKLEEIEERRRRYLEGRPRAEVTGRTVIVVDDGVATGATVKAALRAMRRAGPKRLILAVPVAAPESMMELEREADDCIALMTPAELGAIGWFYADFHQIADEEVVDLLARALPPAEKPPAASA